MVCTCSSALGSRKMFTAEPGELCDFSEMSSWATTSTLSGEFSGLVPIRVESTVTESSWTATGFSVTVTLISRAVGDLYLDGGRLEPDAGDGNALAAGREGKSRQAVCVCGRLLTVGPNHSFGKRGAGLTPNGCDDRTRGRRVLSQEKRGCAGEAEDHQGRASHLSS